MNSKELKKLKKVINKSLRTLLEKDRNIFSNETKVIQINNIQTGVRDRKLHETAINHRFAIYLENNFKKVFKEGDSYQVDIEYNRYFGQPKECNGDLIRPDIIIHKRMGKDLTKDNFLIVEAKKNIESIEDENKVCAIMKNKKYKFKYGLTITFCAEGDSKIIYKLYSHTLGLDNPIVKEIKKDCQ